MNLATAWKDNISSGLFGRHDLRLLKELSALPDEHIMFRASLFLSLSPFSLPDYLHMIPNMELSARAVYDLHVPLSMPGFLAELDVSTMASRGHS